MSGDTVSPWHPMTDAKSVKILGKLMEELGELQAAVARCLIQGIEEKEPVTGKPNKEWLTEEIADVKAQILHTMIQFDLNTAEIHKRQERKFNLTGNWHRMA